MAFPTQSNRHTILNLTLLILALLGPLFHWAGLWLRNLSFFYIDIPKLVAAYLFLMLSAVSAGWLIIHPPDKLVRWLAVIGLLVNISSLAYAGRLWRIDSHLLTNDTVWTPFAADKVGIIVAPVNESSLALAEARTIEETIRQLSKGTALDNLIDIRQVTSLADAKDAQQIAVRMGANIVIWGTANGSELIHSEHYITHLGAGLAAGSLEPASLMLLLTSIGTFNIADNRLASENTVPSTAREILAPVSLALAALSINQPVLAASYFESALQTNSIPDISVQAMRAYYGLALLLADRPDLAQNLIDSNQQQAPSALSKLVEGDLALYRGDFTAAENAYLQARAIDPSSAQAYSGLGIIACEKGSLDRAKALFDEALALEPTWGIVQLLQARQYEYRGDVSAAQAAYERGRQSISPFEPLVDAIAARYAELSASPPTAVPTATIGPTPSPMPIPGLRYHTVAKGETLRQIAQQYGVTEEEIMKLNKLDDVNYLSIGQILVIPED
ncbi:MAG: LysM peptidoglycan-binding domain-containing protein [Anaerolineae bacterium]